MNLQLFKRGIKFFVGLGLYLIYTRRIGLNDIVKDKRIAIIGPANSTHNTHSGKFIDSFDIVIRLNKAPFVLLSGKHKTDIGSKVDILFHSFFENEEFGGGQLDFSVYNRLGISYVVNPLSSMFGYRNTLNFYKKYLVKQVTYFLPHQTFKQIAKRFHRARPTTGFCALYAVLESDFKELFISGFTFFKTPYTQGYRTRLDDLEHAKSTIKAMQIHDPELEFQEFLKVLSKNKGEGKHISMDSVLTEIVETEITQ